MQRIKDSWKDFGDEYNEETLSLCDLVMESDRSNEFWDDDDDCSPKQDENGDSFEFSSEDLPASASISPGNNIIFCGKIISSRESQPNAGNKSQIPKFRTERENHEKRKNFSCGNGCLFPWKTSSSSPSLFNKSRTFPSSKSTKESERQSFNKSFSMPASVSKNKYGKFSDEKFDFPVKKVSTPVKSRWYFFAFGVGRFPMEIELKDMKMRQSRKYTTMKFRSPSGDGDGDGDGGRSENVKSDKERRSGKGFRILLKVLGWKQLFIY
ncbi:GTP binding Elongation factor Tu family protein isoform 1 [Hibiscus syriacus]|uniref:GTP binding Elongation factor Tu family protein isoform 1 n=1 Tax=Hibiscus syriacus TaxID=106335 RepID=A0A6A2Z2Y5_HIBSY|nr:GTP binding Elongation factor Tu family protein isoform 1 [Hibiscus syriacus]KAE8686314.1 GTP binding Elongation factor Tu family protein isoform 1 [Hibiscus syriacus]